MIDDRSLFPLRYTAFHVYIHIANVVFQREIRESGGRAKSCFLSLSLANTITRCKRMPLDSILQAGEERTDVCFETERTVPTLISGVYIGEFFDAPEFDPEMRNQRVVNLMRFEPRPFVSLAE